uniref:Kinesin-like protein n=1 Tax=Rhizochromulina marina TaxID=1034831 RepID=A0A6U1BUB9_9STRA|mmetsp:Transcript_31191/g.90664  ORF Transcript_31191/g.90664 Transcript_31191/m.90664 type:complete len:740 (+) Transcript_31191:55-2274(+)
MDGASTASVDDLRRKCAHLEARLRQVAESEREAHAQVQRLQFMSKSQAAILRTNLSKRIEERDALVDKSLSLLSEFAPSEAEALRGKLLSLQEDHVARAAQVSMGEHSSSSSSSSSTELQVELDGLRSRNKELERRLLLGPGGDEEVSSLRRTVGDLEADKKKLFDLLREARERLGVRGGDKQDDGGGVGAETSTALEAEVSRLSKELEAQGEALKKAKADRKASRKDAEEAIRVLKEQTKAKEKTLVDEMEREVDKLLEEEKAKLTQEKEELRVAWDAEKAELGKQIKRLNKELKKSSQGLRSMGSLRSQVGVLRESAGLVSREARSQLSQVGGVVQSTTLAIVGEVQRRMASVQADYRREYMERRRLFNLVQELRGNIRVFCRCRPPTEKELSRDAAAEVCVTFPEEGSVRVANDRGKDNAWEFDKVFDFGTSQEQVYAEVSPLVTSVLDGYNVCIFAYGQTGSGKTYTMTGPPEQCGVNTRALEELFRRSSGRTDEIRDHISVSILEIYVEQIRDLLGGAEAQGRLEIRHGDQGVHVPGLTVVPVTTMDEVLDLLRMADTNRSTAVTNMNEHSSRSHLMLSVTVRSVNQHSGQATLGKLNLVDLAGSERISKSGATGQALKEAQSINKSLSALGDVIMSRARKSPHVPFRNSTLTHLLQDSLSGDAKTLMFVCVSPVIYNSEETYCSLTFAARVRTVELGKAQRNVVSAAAPPTRTHKRRQSLSGRINKGGGGGWE